MSLHCKNIFRLFSIPIKNCELNSNLVYGVLVKTVGCNFLLRQSKSFHLGTPRMIKYNLFSKRKAKLDALKDDEGIRGASDLDRSLERMGVYPTVDLPNKLFDNIPFKDLPVITINVSRNNTILGLADKGDVKMIRSCGTEGFKNARKGTNVAAQTAGYSMGLRAVKQGYKTVKIVLKGLGPGRLSALKGLELGGVTMVSITDATKDSVSGRPRKQRRI